MREKKLGNKEISTLSRRCSWLLVALIVAGILFATLNMEPAFSTFSSATSAHATFKTGTWPAPKPKPTATVTSVCPCWGPSGACRWAVFVHGTNLATTTQVTLVLGTKSIPALKDWPICGDTVYCVFDLSRAPAGAYDLVVQTQLCGSATLKKGFTVKTCALLSPRITCTVGLLLVNVQIQGKLSSPVASIQLVRGGNVLTGTVTSVLGLLCTGTFKKAAIPAGTYDLVVILRDQSNLLLENALTIR